VQLLTEGTKLASIGSSSTVKAQAFADANGRQVRLDATVAVEDVVGLDAALTARAPAASPFFTGSANFEGCSAISGLTRANGEIKDSGLSNTIGFQLGVKANRDNPTFTTAVAVNGSMTATQVVARGFGAGGTVRSAPTTNGGESSIGFYRNADQSGNAAGDQWVLGHNSWSAGAGNFSIGTLGRGECLTINALTGVANVPYGLSVKNVQLSEMLNRMKPHSAGVMDFNGVVLRDNGKYPWTASRAGAFMTVTLTEPYVYPYGVIATAESTAAYCTITYRNRSSTSFQLTWAEGVPLSITYDLGPG
jgi:hypothetical protein